MSRDIRFNESNETIEVKCAHCGEWVNINKGIRVEKYQVGEGFVCSRCAHGRKVATKKTTEKTESKVNGWVHYQELHYRSFSNESLRLITNDFDLTKHKNGEVTLAGQLACGFGSHSAQVRQLKDVEDLVGIQTLKLYNCRPDMPVNFELLKSNLQKVNNFIGFNLVGVDKEFVKFNLTFDEFEEYRVLVHQCRKIYQAISFASKSEYPFDKAFKAEMRKLFKTELRNRK